MEKKLQKIEGRAALMVKIEEVSTTKKQEVQSIIVIMKLFIRQETKEITN